MSINLARSNVSITNGLAYLVTTIARGKSFITLTALVGYTPGLSHLSKHCPNEYLPLQNLQLPVPNTQSYKTFFAIIFANFCVNLLGEIDAKRPNLLQKKFSLDMDLVAILVIH